MTDVVLGIVAVLSVVLSFVFAAFALVVLSGRDGRDGTRASSAREASADRGGVTETMSRVLGEIEHLVLRAQNTLAEKQLSTQQGRLLDHDHVPELPQRPR